jgi:hypothetical protein
LNVSDIGLTVSEPAPVVAGFTVRVKLCVAFGFTPFCAASVIGNVPLTVGVPPSTPVVALNVTPAGRVPVSLSVGIGVPVAVIMNVPAVPTEKVVEFELVIAGAWLTGVEVFTVSVKVCLGLFPPAFDAVKPIGYDPPVPVPGVPLSTPEAVLNVTPAGNAPVSLNDVGDPVAVTWNIPDVPTVKVVLAALEIDGAWVPCFTVSVKVCLGLVPPAFVAVKPIGYDPLVPVPGVPLSTPEAVLNVTPAGSVPVSLNDVGDPVAVTWNIPNVPTVKVVLAALEIDGAVGVVVVASFSVFVDA